MGDNACCAGSPKASGAMFTDDCAGRCCPSRKRRQYTMRRSSRPAAARTGRSRLSTHKSPRRRESPGQIAKPRATRSKALPDDVGAARADPPPDCDGRGGPPTNERRSSTTAGVHRSGFAASNGSGGRAAGAGAATPTRRERARDRADVPRPDATVAGAVRARCGAADPAAKRER
jgi:hypothetical protein